MKKKRLKLNKNRHFWSLSAARLTGSDLLLSREKKY
jgi:hypothetical protein